MSLQIIKYYAKTKNTGSLLNFILINIVILNTEKPD
jgi:hypothetical protein